MTNKMPIFIEIDREKFKKALKSKGYSIAGLCREFGFNKEHITYSLKVGRINEELLFNITEKIGMFDASKENDQLEKRIEELNKKLDRIITMMEDILNGQNR